MNPFGTPQPLTPSTFIMPLFISFKNHALLEDTHRYLTMHLPLRCYYLFLVGVCTISRIASQECPHLALKAKTRPAAKRGVLAGSGHVEVTVTLAAQDSVVGLEFQLLLPSGTSVECTGTRPHLKPHTSPAIIKNLDGTTALYWLQIELDRPRKRRFMARVHVNKCAPETLAIDAFAYLVNATSISCATSLSCPARIRVRYLKIKRPATCAPTPAPSVNPAEPFVLFGEGQRFSRNDRLAPSIDTREDCYEYCSINKGESDRLLSSGKPSV